MLTNILKHPQMLITSLLMVFIISCGGSTSSNNSVQGSSSCVEDSSQVLTDPVSDEECAKISVYGNLSGDADLDSIYALVVESMVTGLADELSKARVLSASDVKDALLYAQFLQALGGDGDEALLSTAVAYSRGDILVVPSVGKVDETYTMTVSAINAGDVSISVEKIATVSYAGSLTGLGQSAESLGAMLAEKIKKARICISVSPKPSVIDYDQPSERTVTFTATVKDLKDQGLDSGSVSFSIDEETAGTLSATSSEISAGTASTNFTMTSRQPNMLTAEYQGEYVKQDAKSRIVPLCGLFLQIIGDKVFDLDQANIPLLATFFGEGSWLTMHGTSNITGEVPLGVLTEGSESAVYGEGWYGEVHISTGATHLEIKDYEGNLVGTCDGSGSTDTSDSPISGSWLIIGSIDGDNNMAIQGIAAGESPTGQTIYGSCSLAGITAVDSGSSGLSGVSEFSGASLKYEAGSSTTVSGTGALLDDLYNYTLTIKRASR